MSQVLVVKRRHHANGLLANLLQVKVIPRGIPYNPSELAGRPRTKRVPFSRLRYMKG